MTCAKSFAIMIVKSLRKLGGRLSGPAAFLRLSFFNLTITRSSKIRRQNYYPKFEDKTRAITEVRNEHRNPFEAIGAGYQGLTYYRSKSKTKLES